MKKSLGLAALACTMAVGGTTVAQAQSSSAFATFAALLLAEQFMMPRTVIVEDASMYGVPVYEMEPAYAIYYRTRVPVRTLWGWHRSGLAWDAIALRAGLGQNEVVYLGNQGYWNPNIYWGNVAYRTWHVPRQEFIAVRTAGAPWEDAFYATRAAYQFHTRPLVVWQSYRQTHNWRRLNLGGRVVTWNQARTPVRLRPLARPTVWRTAFRPNAATQRALRMGNHLKMTRRGITPHWQNPGSTTTHNGTQWRMVNGHRVRVNGRVDGRVTTHATVHRTPTGSMIRHRTTVTPRKTINTFKRTNSAVHINRTNTVVGNHRVRVMRVRNPQRTIVKKQVWQNGHMTHHSVTSTPRQNPHRMTGGQRHQTRQLIHHKPGGGR